MCASPVRDVSGWPVASWEAVGSSNNTWLVDDTGETWLFKPNRMQRNGQEQGEDWAEVLAAAVARSLGVPAAHVEMVERRVSSDVVRGAASRNIIRTGDREAGWELQLGAVLLTGVEGFRLYRSDSTRQPVKDHVGHTVTTVCEVLDDVLPPLDAPTGLTAAETFAGYLVLDALIGNQDRHEENWAVVVEPGAPVRLAPSFDHAASLGFQLADGRRALLLADDEKISCYAAKGAALKFQGGSTPLTELAADALVRSGPGARGAWLARLGDVRGDGLAGLVDGIPGMSEVARTFCTKLLVTNRRRLLDVCR